MICLSQKTRKTYRTDCEKEAESFRAFTLDELKKIFMSIEIEDEVFPKFSTWIHTESGRKNTTAFSEFNVELIDTENLAQKFDQRNDLEALLPYNFFKRNN